MMSTAFGRGLRRLFGIKHKSRARSVSFSEMMVEKPSTVEIEPVKSTPKKVVKKSPAKKKVAKKKVAKNAA